MLLSALFVMLITCYVNAWVSARCAVHYMHVWFKKLRAV